eukprot:1422830-Amphidinium_carterae.2
MMMMMMMMTMMMIINDDDDDDDDDDHYAHTNNLSWCLQRLPATPSARATALQMCHITNRDHTNHATTQKHLPLRLWAHAIPKPLIAYPGYRCLGVPLVRCLRASQAED